MILKPSGFSDVKMGIVFSETYFLLPAHRAFAHIFSFLLYYTLRHLKYFGESFFLVIRCGDWNSFYSTRYYISFVSLRITIFSNLTVIFRDLTSLKSTEGNTIRLGNQNL